MKRSLLILAGLLTIALVTAWWMHVAPQAEVARRKTDLQQARAEAKIVESIETAERSNNSDAPNSIEVVAAIKTPTDNVELAQFEACRSNAVKWLAQRDEAESLMAAAALMLTQIGAPTSEAQKKRHGR